MRVTRRNVWDLGGEWADPILWYARGVAALKARPLAEPTSWRFYGAIHGFDVQRWQELGYLSTTDQPPSAALLRQFWRQCQHGSWYFLPWHRGYLLAFEANIRAEVVRLNGPADWALPYWNYFKPNQSALPVEFASPDWPDGTGDNPLFVSQRYGPRNDGNVFVPINLVNLLAMSDPDFTGVSSGGSPGFGGVDTGFSHGGRVHGGIESQPHDWVHGLVGGADPNNPNSGGVMSDPDTAGLDPIFWLHHANIDRLWESWNRATSDHVNPTEPNWVNGPASIGERAFSMPMPDGSTWTYAPTDVSDLSSLGYEYDDLSLPVTPVPPADRLERLGLAPAEGAETMPGETNVELVGANNESVPVRGSEVKSHVQLDSEMRHKVTESLSRNLGLTEGAAVPPDRVFLNLENLRGQADAAAFQVYVGVSDDENPDDHPERLAGSIAPFGLRKASQSDEEHAGQGLTFVLEITDIVDQLHLEDSFDVDDLPVRLVPVTPIADEAEVTIGRISIFRQGR
ncbi:MAG TPA: tyrosinase family protein [Propionibacteriaceae bacterium]|nr:tyrosinase family protein [Propionibacteriaceae bacterium]